MLVIKELHGKSTILYPMERNRKKEVQLTIPVEENENQGKQRGFAKSAHRYFKEYCNSTSIHGLKYLAESRTLCEKLLWLVLISCSLSACIYLIFQIYTKFQQSPVIVSFATTESPIYTIPFPAVTICPQTIADKSIFNFTDVMRRLKRGQDINKQEERYAKYMALVCEKMNDFFPNETFFTDDFYVGLEELKIPMSKTMILCSFMNVPYPCEDMFHPVILDKSICFTFNMLDRSSIFSENVIHYSNYHSLENKPDESWTVDNGYDITKRQKDDFDYPLRAFLAGADNSLEILFYQNFSDNDYLCLKDTQGFNVALHAPFAMPQVKKQYFNVGYDRSVMTVVKPSVMATSKKVLNYNPNVRECYFSTEKKLKYYKIYSPRNCKLECFTKFTLNACGCVAYYMPRENGTKICGNSNYLCMERAEMDLKVIQLQRQIEDENEDFYCDCKPLCTDLSYDTEVTASPWQFRDQIKAMSMDDNKEYDNNIHFAKLSVFFKSDSFLTSERNELYGPTDFLANFGGLLGLFTGFSLLSAAEIIYFLTVRMCCNFRMFRYWTGPNQQK